jgi:hypothetical protein
VLVLAAGGVALALASASDSGGSTPSATPTDDSGGGARASGGGSAGSGGGAVRVRVWPRQVVATSRLTLGVTHTQHSLDPWGDPESIVRAERLLSFAKYQNQHIYGWGAGNPEPQPGVMDWRTLDRRMALIDRLGATPIITLCCAPDWMTRRGTTTSDFPNLPPTPEHYDDFAELARQIAERYPRVRRFMVWNEMKGFWNRSAHNWDFRAYTELYNRVYAALKSVNPNIKVGGPYLVLEGTGAGDAAPASRVTADPITERDQTVLDYWLDHASGADFVAIDRKLQSKHDGHHYSRHELLGFTHWFGDVVRQIHERTQLPVVFAEDYFANSTDRRFTAAGLASMLAEEVRAGALLSLRWGPQAERGDRGQSNGQSLFTDTRHPGGGRPLPAQRVYAGIGRWFGRGTDLVQVQSSSRDIGVLATRDRVLLINRTPDVQRVVVEKGTKLRLPPWGVRFAQYQ